MKIVCTRKNLSHGLGINSRVIVSGNTLPILNNILFKTESGRLKLSSTNLEMAINTWVGGQVTEDGEITVPAKLIHDYVSNLYTDKVILTTDGLVMKIEAEKAQTHINGLSAEDFPLIPEIKDSAFTKLDSNSLRDILRQVTFSTAFSETQPEISGVLFSFEGKTLTLAATDRYRLAEGKIDLLTEVLEIKQVIIPSRAVNELGRILGEGVLEIYLTEGQVCFKTSEVELVSRLIEGQYPDYRQIIPKAYSTEAEISRSEFIQSLKATSLFSSDNNNIEIELDPETKKLSIRSKSAQTGDSEMTLDINILGEKNQIIFNYRYLLECLNQLVDDKVVLKIINSSSPAALVPFGRENYLYIVMPIKI